MSKKSQKTIAIVGGIVAAVAIAAGLASYYYLASDQPTVENVLSESNNNSNKSSVQVVAPEGSLTAEWWQWAISIPPDRNPVVDTTGEFCNEGQSGEVFNLAGTFGGKSERSCMVNQGVDLLVSPINAECSEAEGSGTTEEEQRACAVAGNDGAEVMFELTGPNVSISLDDAELEDYRVQSPQFILEFPEDEENIFGLPEGTRTTAVSDGYWVLVKDLPKGEYTLHARGSVIDFTEGAANTFVSEVVYHITVA